RGSFVISRENLDVRAELFTVQVDPFVVIERLTFLVLKLPTGAAEPLQVATVGIPQHSPHEDVRLIFAVPDTAEIFRRYLCVGDSALILGNQTVAVDSYNRREQT